MSRPQRKQSPRRPAAAVGAAVAESTGAGSDDNLCTCCDPRNPLVMRPDLGTLGDGSAEYALCVLHEPQPVVYRNRGDGMYVPVPHLSLNSAGELVDANGNVVAHVAGDGFQRLSTLDDDEPPPPPDPGGGPSAEPGGAARPATFHVDLSQDDFYRT